jgi:ATP-dependent DNA ligase
LRRRKEILSQIVNLPNVRVSEHIEQHGRAFYRVVAEQGLEGIVAKDGRSKYATGRRSNSWYKIKAKRQQLAVIGGFAEQRGNPRVIGSLILGAYRAEPISFTSEMSERGSPIRRLPIFDGPSSRTFKLCVRSRRNQR